MIQFSNKSLKLDILSIWNKVFGDKDEYINLIFSKKYKDENTSVYFFDGIAVAALYMFPYTLRYYNKTIPFYYLGGLSTLPQYRNRGYMSKLIFESFRTMQHRNIPLAILVPAEEWLFDYYEKFGFEKTFDKSETSIPMERILKEYNKDQDSAFAKFDRDFQQTNICVLKDKEDFDLIIEEYIMDGMPEKYNLPAMSRIIDPEFLLKIYAENNPDLNFSLKLYDEKLGIEKTFQVKKGEVSIENNIKPDFEVNERMFIRLLMGYRIEELPSKFHPFFRKNKPVINLMLE